MATKTFEELKQLAIQIRDEKTNKQNTATRIGTQMLEHLNKLEQDYYDKTATDEELKQRDEKLTELSSPIMKNLNRIQGISKSVYMTEKKKISLYKTIQNKTYKYDGNFMDNTGQNCYIYRIDEYDNIFTTFYAGYTPDVASIVFLGEDEDVIDIPLYNKNFDRYSWCEELYIDKPANAIYMVICTGGEPSVYSSNYVYDNIDLLKKQLKPRLKYGYYINKDGNLTQYNAAYTTEYMLIPDDGDIIDKPEYLEIDNQKNAYHSFTFFDADFKYLSGITVDKGNLPDGSYKWDNSITPEKSKYFVLIRNNTYPIRIISSRNLLSGKIIVDSDEYLKKADFDAYKKGNDAINEKVDDTITNNFSESKSPLAFVEKLEGQYYNPYGVLAEAEGYNAYVYEIDSLSFNISVNLHVGFKGNSHISFLDEDRNFISDVDSEWESYTQYNDFIIDYKSLPGKSKYLALSGNESESNFAAYKLVYRLSSIWSNKKWVCFGDSLTELNNRTTKHYFDYIAEKTGIKIINMGLGGSGYKRREDEGLAFYQRILNVLTDADVITIFGSGNDLKLISSLGVYTDDNTDTICGCINKCIDNLFSVYPLAVVALVTPTPWINFMPTDTPDNDLERYSNAIIQIAKYRGIPYLDLYHNSLLRPSDSVFRGLAYTKDDGGGVHPDEIGHKMIAPRFYSLLNSLIF